MAEMREEEETKRQRDELEKLWSEKKLRMAEEQRERLANQEWREEWREEIRAGVETAMREHEGKETEGR